jgi:vacuolar-type H+-ATPase subunit H
MGSGAIDVEVAQAINEVLAAEREAASVIEAARLSAEALIEAARAERRRLLEHTRARASRLHAAAQLRLERELAQLERAAAEPAPEVARLDELTRLAVGRLVRRLTAADHEPT